MDILSRIVGKERYGNKRIKQMIDNNYSDAMPITGTTDR